MESSPLLPSVSLWCILMLDFCLPHSLSTFSDIIRSYTLYLLYHCKADSNHFRSFSADATATLLFCCVIRPRKINSKFNLFLLFRHGKKTPEDGALRSLYAWRQTVPERALRLEVGRRQEGRKQSLEKKGCPVSRYSAVVTCARSLIVGRGFMGVGRNRNRMGLGVGLNFAVHEIEPGIEARWSNKTTQSTGLEKVLAGQIVARKVADNKLASRSLATLCVEGLKRDDIMRT